MPFLGCPGQPDAILQPTEIGHYFCGIFPLLRVASADTDITAALVVAFSGIVSLINFVILCVSHNILLFTLQNHSAGETQTPLCLWASCRCGLSLLAPVSFACLRPPVLTLWTRLLLCFTPSERGCLSVQPLHLYSEEFRDAERHEESLVSNIIFKGSTQLIEKAYSKSTLKE